MFNASYNVSSNQKLSIVFFYKRNLKQNETLTNETINVAFRESMVNIGTEHSWFEKFHSGNFNLQYEPRGRIESIVNKERN